jgi:hypothetical protein
VPIPEVPYPHVNDTKQFQKHVWLIEWTGNAVIGVAAAVLYVLFNKLTPLIPL